MLSLTSFFEGFLNSYFPEYFSVVGIELKILKMWPEQFGKNFPWNVCYEKVRK